MANYNTVITNEGAALLASVIASQGTLTLSEMRFSTNDYSGSEATLTYGTFSGVFITAAAAGSVVDSTTIKAASQFDNSTLVGDNPLYSIGLVGTDGNTTALIAVSTTTAPDIIRPAVTGVSTYAFNMNLTVSSTNNITVVGTTAAVLYDVDVVDTLISTATNKPLSANQGRLVADNLAANENVYGAKNLNSYPYYHGNRYTNGITFTDNGDGTITATGTALADALFSIHSRDITEPPILEVTNGNYIFTGCPSGGNGGYGTRVFQSAKITGTREDYGFDYGDGLSFTVDGGYYSDDYAVLGLHIIVFSGTALPVGGITFKPMLRDARILDPTYEPYAKTNQQLTADKAERNDLSTIHATGSTNVTGTPINAGSFFYLNNQFCKALQYIDNGATFTENTNYKNTNLGEELPNTPLIQITNAGTSYTIERNEPYVYSSYCIRNGLVFVNVAIKCVTPESSWSKVCDIPRSSVLTSIDPPIARSPAPPHNTIPIFLQNGELFATAGTASEQYHVSFCYPI